MQRCAARRFSALGTMIMALATSLACERDELPVRETTEAAVKTPQAETDAQETTEAEPSACQPSVLSQDCSAPRGSWYLHLSDIHLQIKGEMHNGNSTELMWEAAKRRVASLVSSNPPAFILITGDLLGYNLDLDDRQDVVARITNDLATFGVPVLVAPGNNDTLNVDYGPFTTEPACHDSICKGGEDQQGEHEQCCSEGFHDGKATPWSNPVKNLGTDKWGWLNEGLGSWTALPVANAKLRVIGINTVSLSSYYPCGPHDEACCGCSSNYGDGDAGLEISKLSTALADAKAKGEKVLIAMHIPPGQDYKGNSEWTQRDTYTDEFLCMIQAYESTIVGIAYGHSHMDENRRLCSPSGEPGVHALAVSAPGIIQNHGNNSGVKGVSFELGSLALTDTKTWWNELADGSDFPADHCYTLRNTLCCDAKTAPELLDCFEQDGPKLVEKLDAVANVGKAGTVAKFLDAGQCSGSAVGLPSGPPACANEYPWGRLLSGAPRGPRGTPDSVPARTQR